MYPEKSSLHTSAAPRPVPYSRHLNQTILVVEDDEDSRLVLKLILQMRGYRVIEAADGQAAIETAARERPELILMDLTLPRVDGLTATLRIRERTELCRVPIVVISGHSVADFRAVALDAGCSEYITKPIDFDHLEELLVSLL